MSHIHVAICKGRHVQIRIYCIMMGWSSFKFSVIGYWFSSYFKLGAERSMRSFVPISHKKNAGEESAFSSPL